jgi:hypothetical protein
MDTTRLAKLLALTGSNHDNEALVALRKAQASVAANGKSWTALMHRAAYGEDRGEDVLHRQIIALLRAENRDLKNALKRVKADLEKQAKAVTLKRSRATIAAEMRKVLGDPVLAGLSDRELARRTGLSPQTIGNWRRRAASC